MRGVERGMGLLARVGAGIGGLLLLPAIAGLAADVAGRVGAGDVGTAVAGVVLAVWAVWGPGWMRRAGHPGWQDDCEVVSTAGMAAAAAGVTVLAAGGAMAHAWWAAAGRAAHVAAQGVAAALAGLVVLAAAHAAQVGTAASMAVGAVQVVAPGREAGGATPRGPPARGHRAQADHDTIVTLTEARSARADRVTRRPPEETAAPEPLPTTPSLIISSRKERVKLSLALSIAAPLGRTSDGWPALALPVVGGAVAMNLCFRPAGSTYLSAEGRQQWADAVGARLRRYGVIAADLLDLIEARYRAHQAPFDLGQADYLGLRGVRQHVPHTDQRNRGWDQATRQAMAEAMELLALLRGDVAITPIENAKTKGKPKTHRATGPLLGITSHTVGERDGVASWWHIEPAELFRVFVNIRQYMSLPEAVIALDPRTQAPAKGLARYVLARRRWAEHHPQPHPHLTVLTWADALEVAGLSRAARMQPARTDTRLAAQARIAAAAIGAEGVEVRRGPQAALVFTFQKKVERSA